MNEQSESPNADELKVQKALGGKISGLDLLAAHTRSVGGETRPNQELMAEAVSQAIETQEDLVVEAGTGTGKSLAYLAAAVASGKRTVIATATNQLSDQLALKDCPSLAETAAAAGEGFTFSSLKGRQNYVCLAKIADLKAENAKANEMLDFGDEESERDNSGLSEKVRKAKSLSDEVNKVVAWSQTTETGEISEAPAVSNGAWAKVSVTSKQCPGAFNCPFGEECFAELARRKSRTSKVVITNHALLSQGADYSGQGSAEIVGNPEVIIVDEAHNLSQSLTSALSFVINEESLLAVTKECGRAIAMLGMPTSLGAAETSIESLFAAAYKVPEGKIESLPPAAKNAAELVLSELMQLRTGISRKNTDKGLDDKTKAQAEIALTAIDSIVSELTILKKDSDPAYVKWISTDSKGAISFNIAPLDVSNYFQEVVADTKSVIATSATMKVGGSFGPIQEELGMEDSRAIDVGSPFEYSKQGILYVPDATYPAPVGSERQEHKAASQESIIRLVKASGGRALCLFTTTKAAVETGERLREELNPLGIDVLVTGEAAADHLVSEFRENETSVLCATMGMWQGTDVPGNSCVLVVIDKIPFPTPDDVLNKARAEHASAQGKNGFYAVSVKHAAVSLAQGVGRLIRRSSDKGAVAILDSRIRSKAYGKTLLEGLPGFVQTSSEETVESALKRLVSTLPAPEPKPKSFSTPGSIKPLRKAHSGTTPVPNAKTKSLGKRNR